MSLRASGVTVTHFVSIAWSANAGTRADRSQCCMGPGPASLIIEPCPCPFDTCSFYSSAVAGREALAATIPVRRLREAIAREDKFVSRLAETAAAELGASGSSTGAGGAGAAGGGGAGYTFGSPAFSPLRAGGAKEAWEMSTPSPGLSRSTRVQGKFEVDGRDVRAGIARHMYDHVHSGAASTPPDWQRTKKDTFYHLKTRSSEERPASQQLESAPRVVHSGFSCSAAVTACCRRPSP